jgi:hypothetical protein
MGNEHTLRVMEQRKGYQGRRARRSRHGTWDLVGVVVSGKASGGGAPQQQHMLCQAPPPARAHKEIEWRIRPQGSSPKILDSS